MNLQYISETPAKRRKIGDDPSPKTFDSEDDSGDEIFTAYETVATVPLPNRSLQSASHGRLSPQTQRLTQPTQILPCPSDDRHPTLAEHSSTIQVTASSPVPSNLAPPRNLPALATTIAPAGTSFRPPNSLYRSPVLEGQDKTLLEISDDDSPRYRGDSSDDESQFVKAHIKPISFGVGPKRESGQTDRNRFQEVISITRYEPGHAENAKDIPLDAISDIQVRQKIRRMLQILPGRSVLECRDALLRKRNDFQDAMDFLSQHQINENLDQVVSTKPTAKQQLKEPVNKNLHLKWAKQPKSQQVSAQSPPHIKALPDGKPRRRRLVRKGPGLQQSPEKIVIPSDSSDFDSGIEVIASDEDASGHQALDFFRTCSLSDLIDTASVSEEVASHVIAQRPFATLENVRRISKDASNKNGKKQRSQRIGERVVDKVTDMLAGYETVDKLIKTCEGIARPLAEEMVSAHACFPPWYLVSVCFLQGN